MSFKIERSKVVFKHLIRVGPDINTEEVAKLAIERDYVKKTREIKTRTGPLNEYLFSPKSDPQSLIIFSKKGFVIDTQPSNNVLPLFRDAYDFYEKVMGDNAHTATIIMDLLAHFEVYCSIPVDEFLSKSYQDNVSTLTFGDKELRPNGITLASGSGVFPEEFIQLAVQPNMKDPKHRLMVMLIYRSAELDDALKFIEIIDSSVQQTLDKILELNK
ncbi:MAG: hypothetical protein FK733_13185 [Asgard group archaeon]|nr:hypothetical protein [Asgard group archaeon]